MKSLKYILLTCVFIGMCSVVHGAFPYTPAYTVSSGNTITADHYNSANSTHINNNIPESIDDYSANATEMGTVVDPYPSGVVSLAPTLAGELERLRYQILEIQKVLDPTATLWYGDVSDSLFLGEKASAGADVAAFGQYWIKTATPNQAWFTDDAGSDFQIATLTGTETFSNKTLTSPVLTTPVLGTPSSGDISSCTGGPTLTSPVFNTGVSGTAIKDEDTMSSDSSSHLATQQSIKAYVDTQVTGIVTNSAFSVHRNAVATTYNFASTIAKKIRFTTEDYDTNSDFAIDAADTDSGGVLSRFTPTVAGKYLLIVGILTSSNLNDQTWYEPLIYKNGSLEKSVRLRMSGTASSGAILTATVEANGSTDYFEAWYNGNTAGNTNLSGAVDGTFFQGSKIQE